MKMTDPHSESKKEQEPFPEEEEEGNGPHLGWFFLIFIVLCLGIRLRVMSNLQTVTKDAFEYKRVARYVLDGDWSSVVDHEYHPLYPVVMALGYLVTGDWAIGGQMMSLLGSLLGGMGLFWFTWRMTENKTLTLVTGILYALHPYQARLGVQILTMGVYTGFVGMILAFAAEGIHSRKYIWWILSGLCIPFAFLVRIDGLLFLGIFVVWLLYWVYQKHERRGELTRQVGLVLLISFVPFLGFVSYRSIQKGQLDLSGKIKVSKITGKLTGERPLEGQNVQGETTTQRFLSILDEIQQEILDGIGYFFLLFWLIGFFFLKRYTGSNLLLGLFYVHLVLSVVSIATGGFLKGRLDTRHVVPLMTMTLPLAAVSILVFSKWVRRKISWLSMSTGHALTAVLIILGAATIQKTLKPLQTRWIHQRELGLAVKKDWEKTNSSKIPYLITRHSQIVFYSGGTSKRHEKFFRKEGTVSASKLEERLRNRDFEYIDLDLRAVGENFYKYYRLLRQYPFLKEVAHAREIYDKWDEKPREHVIFRKIEE